MTDLSALLATLEAAANRKRYRKLDFFVPSPKQWEFIAKTKTHNEVMIRAGNQQGKSEVGGYVDGLDLTGDYPKDYPGRKFTKPIVMWVAGVKGTDVRDTMQAKLCGEPGVQDAFGTGFIPKEAFVEYPTMARGTSDLFDTVQVKHLAPGGGGTVDGVSVLRFKTYPEERAGFQGKPVDVIHLDEEPPPGKRIYEECQARTISTNGLIRVTLTPKMGKTELILYFDQKSEEEGTKVALVRMGLNDVTHLSEERKAEIMAQFRTARDRDAILWGNPVQGEGRVFEVDEGNLLWAGEPLPEWAKIWGMDWGQTHPFGAVLLCIDRDTGVHYVTHTVRLVGASKLQHIAAIRAIGANVPVAWPHDMGRAAENGDGDLTQLASQYRDPGGMPGLNMLASHATFVDGGFSTWAGIELQRSLMELGQFRVHERNADWFDEYRDYHVENGKLVKIKDDLLSATRVALMASRFAKAGPLGSRVIRKAPRPGTTASGIGQEHWGMGYDETFNPHGPRRAETPRGYTGRSDWGF